MYRLSRSLLPPAICKSRRGAWRRLGDKEAAMVALERAYAAREAHLQNLKIDPHFDSLRLESRFADVMRRVGFTTQT